MLDVKPVLKLTQWVSISKSSVGFALPIPFYLFRRDSTAHTDGKVVPSASSRRCTASSRPQEEIGCRGMRPTRMWSG